MKVAVIVCANGEWHALRALFPQVEAESTPFGECFDLQVERWPLTFFHGGWGKVSAAASAQYVIDHFQPDLLVNLGTCGGFQGRIEQGTIILVERTIIYDIIEQMTDPVEAIQHYSTDLDLEWLPRVTPTPVLRGQLVSADRDIRAEDIAPDKEITRSFRRLAGLVLVAVAARIAPEPGANRKGKLVIVESPAKAKTVGRYLGRGYTVRASVGHVRDLLKSQLSVDVENNFTPKYRVSMESSRGAPSHVSPVRYSRTG